jgi:signal peptidase II
MSNANEEEPKSMPAERLQPVPEQTSTRQHRPNYVFFATVAAVVLVLDVASKAWAVVTLDSASHRQPVMVIVKDSLSFVLAYNRGGAWGLFNGAADAFRKPFFLTVSLLAILFIVSLYRKLQPGQWALRWGLPLVLGGALGNLMDRVTRVGVVDFIDYRADWVLGMNQLISKFSKGWTITDHWPTFNVADIAICVGVGLMALDVLFAKRRHVPSGSSLAPAPNGPVA